MEDKIPISIHVCVKNNERLQKLIDKHGLEAVQEALGSCFEYEVYKELGDIYKEAIIVDDSFMDSFEELF